MEGAKGKKKKKILARANRPKKKKKKKPLFDSSKKNTLIYFFCFTLIFFFFLKSYGPHRSPLSPSLDSHINHIFFLLMLLKKHGRSTCMLLK
jgi:hypothetical protein